MLGLLFAQAAQTGEDVVVELTGCEDTRSALCDLVLDVTGSQTAADAAYLVIGKPLRIVAILLIAWLLTRLVRRGGRRVAAWFARAADKKADVEGRALTVEERRRFEDRAETVRRVARSLAIALIWSVAVLLILAELGVNLFPLLAAAGVAGLAVGLGAQSLVRDYVTGLFLLAEGQFGVGDEVDLGEASGVVEDVTLRITTVRDVDGDLWYVPNGEIKRVGNMSQTWSRALVDLRIPYEADTARVKEIVQSVTGDLRADPEWAQAFLDEPREPFVLDLGADAIVVRVTLRVRRESKRRIERQLRERIKQAFDEAGIELQLPQQLVVLQSSAPSSSTTATPQLP